MDVLGGARSLQLKCYWNLARHPCQASTFRLTLNPRARRRAFFFACPSQPRAQPPPIMTENDVKRSQADKIYIALFLPTNYLVRPRRRMNELAFPPDDPLFVLVCAAYEALNPLRNHRSHAVVRRCLRAAQAEGG